MTETAPNHIHDALEPFAAIGRWLNVDWQDDSTDWPGSVSECENAPPMPTAGDLRRARTAYDAIGLKAEHIEAFRTVLESVLSAETSGARSPAIDFEARRFIRDHGAAILASLSPDDASAADAEIGRDFLNAIEAARDEYPWLADWTPAERYGELVGDLLNIAFPGGSASSDIVRDVVRKAILFSDWAAGEGIFSSNPHIADPADFMSRLYVRGDETPDAIADAAVSCLSTHTAAGAGPVGEADKRAAIDRWVKIEGALDDLVHVALNLLEAPATKRLQGNLRERVDLACSALNEPEPNTAWMRPAEAPAGPVGEAVAYIAQVEEENELLRRDRDAVEKLYYKANRDLLETIGVLRPFADLSELIQQDDPDDKRIMSLQRGRSDWAHVTVGDFRMAAAAQLPRSESDRDDKYYRSVAEANDPNFGIEEPGELERLKRERDAQYDENVNRVAAEGAAILRAEAAEAALRETRAREKRWIERHDDQAAKVIDLEADLSETRAALKAHHDWHLAQEEGPDGVGGAEAYADSPLCSQTVAAITGDAQEAGR